MKTIPFKAIIDTFRSAAGPWPAAVAAAAGALCASAAACGGMPWYIAAAAVLLLGAFQTRPRAAVMALCAVLTALSAGLQRTFEADFGVHPLYGTATVEADDAGVSALPGLGGGRSSFAAKLVSFTAADGTVLARAARGRVKVVLPRGTPAPFFGTLLRVTGRILPPGTTANPGRPGRRTAVLIAEKLAAAGRLRSWRSVFLELRDRVLEKLFAHVENPETRQLAAALFCGVVSGVPYEVRDRFSAAGIVHIFSVSGMHIAVLAFTLGVLLRFLPFKARYAALMLAVWGYILGTGAGTPAVRAGVMVSLWCVLRMRLLKLPGFDILCWTLTLFLIVEPFLAASPGAQFSFLITGALILLGARQERNRDGAVGESDYLPACFRTNHVDRVRRFASGAWFLFCGALTAFFAAAAVSLYLPTARLAPVSIFANVLLGFLMPWYFALFFIQLSTEACGAGALTAPLFEAAFACLRRLAAFTDGVSPTFVGPSPPWPFAAAYALALLVFLGAEKLRARMLAAAVAAACTAWWLCAAHGAPPAVLVISAGYHRAVSVAVADTASRRALLVNCPNRSVAILAEKFFRERGLAEVDVLGDTDGSRGISALHLKIRRRRSHRENARWLRRTAANVAAPLESARLHRDIYALNASKNGLRLEYSDPGSKLCFGLNILDGDRGREIALKYRGKAAHAVLPWSTDTENWKYEFDLAP